jgi:hypothetical protein
MSLLDTASLICTPNGYKEGKLYSVIPSDGSGDMSVVRATTATRVNSAGLVELVPYNIFTYSSSFSNAAWGKLNATVTGGQSGYDGTTNAFLLTDDSTSGVHVIAQVPIVSGQHTISIYAKANTLNWVWLRGVQSSSNVRAWFNLSTGTIGTVETNGTANIESVGNGWYRCSLTIANHESGFEFYYGVSNADNTPSYVGSGQSIFVQDAQLVEGSTAKDYQKTETRLNIPRLDYSNGTCPSLLVEPQRTNLLTYSSSFDNAAWNKLDTTISANSIASPSGVQDADKIQENTNNSFHLIEQMYATTSGTNYALSFYVKKAERNYAVFGVYVSESKQIRVDLTNGTIVSTNGTWVNTDIQDAGNGWYRVSGVFTAATLAYVFFGPDLNGNANAYIGTSGSGIYAWGAQLEAGSYATSYIPTTSASVTRNADVISKTGISSLIGQTEGTLFVDLDWVNNGVDSVFATISDGTTSNRIHFGYAASGNFWYLYSEASGASQANITFAAPSNGKYRLAIGYKLNDYAFYVNGTQIGVDTSASVPATSQFNLGGFITTGLEHSVNYAALWPTRLTNTQLAQLTTI